MCGKYIAQGTYLKTSFIKNDVTDVTGNSLPPGATTLDLPSAECWAGFYIYAQTRCGHLLKCSAIP